jgi:uncharacterized protein (UPF0335 family)
MILETDADREKLSSIVERYRVLEDQIKAAKDEQKELAESAKANLGVPAKALKQAAKEMGWDSVERAAQRQLEDALDACRQALGLLADTPLGQAAQSLAKDIRAGKADLKVGDGPWLSETMGNGQAEPKRDRGRPKGSKNKPRGETPAPPAIPDDPLAGAPWN